MLFFDGFLFAWHELTLRIVLRTCFLVSLHLFESGDEGLDLRSLIDQAINWVFRASCVLQLAHPLYSTTRHNPAEMKFSTIALAALLPAVALTQDARAIDYPDSPDGEGPNLDKRYVAGRVVVDGLRYRKCPRTSCTAVGQYAAGTPIQIQCYTRTGTTVENGDS